MTNGTQMEAKRLVRNVTKILIAQDISDARIREREQLQLEHDV